MNIKFSLFFFSLLFFAFGMDPSGLSSKRSHIPVSNRGSPHLIVQSRGGAKIQQLSGARLNPNRDRSDEMGVKRTRNGGCFEVYPLSGDALVLLSRVMLRLDGCRDLLCPGIQPTAVRYLCVPAFVRM